MKKIVVAGGCFWGVQEYFRRLKGVLDTAVGYAQGITKDPTYEEVCEGNTNHVEACYVTYDEKVLRLDDICDHLFRIIDPLSLNRQGGDRGTQYRTGIYYEHEEDMATIHAFIEMKQKAFRRQIVVEFKKLDVFYPAETYHQDYLQKHAGGYCHVDFSKIREEEHI